HDPICQRSIALKKIREDLQILPHMRQKFLREARIASQLTHPSIITIYSIYNDPNATYYTMPYIEGETLRKILSYSKKESLSDSKTSIPFLSRVFLQICEAIAYTHTKGIIHRDLKPENIIIGKYGEVFIIDWGIAEFEEKLQKKEPFTLPKKIAGTLTYLSPEIAKGEPFSISSDIYALGAILYYILTLFPPFQRASLEEWQQYLTKENLPSPFEKAPYRDIPQELADIAQKALSFEKKDRYLSVDELLVDLKNYIEGKPKWTFIKSLQIQEKDDWDFQENLLLAKHIAITRNTDCAEWFHVMLSKEVFSGNLKIQTTLHIDKECEGIGFLLSPPKSYKQKGIDEGYSLWLTPQKALLFRSNVLVKEVPFSLKTENTYDIVIEKTDNHLLCFINNKLLFTHSSYFPLLQNQIGVLHKGAHFQMKPLQISSASHNVMVPCLAVPDAFLSHKFYNIALSEYERIGHSFTGRTEGREALFRAGITLLEKAKDEKKDKNLFLEKAFEAFEKLHNSLSAPLEYLGKSLVYKEWEDREEEAKCLELAIRKFHNHPQFSILEEHLLYRIHESSLEDREGVYRLALIGLLHLPTFWNTPDTQNLLQNLQKHWEKVYFFLAPSQEDEKEYLSLELSFRIPRKETLLEILHTLCLEKTHCIENGLFALLELGFYDEFDQMVKDLEKEPISLTLKEGISLLQIANQSHVEDPSIAFSLLEKFSPFSPRAFTVLIFILNQAILHRHIDSLRSILLALDSYPFSKTEEILIDSARLSLLLLEKNFTLMKPIFQKYSLEQLNQESFSLHALYGIWLYATEGENIAKAHFSKELEISHPPTPALLGQFLSGKKLSSLFFWEKKKVYQDLFLFHESLGDPKKSLFYHKIALENPDNSV
ncbi:MAG: protein kinase, partial [Chlamydiota bacterium]